LGGVRVVHEPAIEPYDETYRDEVLHVLAEAYAAAPVSCALVRDTGAEQLRQVRVLFELRLPTMSGERLVAVRDGHVVGFAHWVQHPPSGAGIRQPPPGAQSHLAMLAEGVLPRLASLVQVWQSHDLQVPHSHLGPIAVAPSFQGMGIARRFLQRYCLELDECRRIAYLETDQSENVRLFSNFGFVVTSEVEVLGVKNWFMTRHVE
jgi:GNAT superfamily N-acetyltransferase